jgi:predicted Zn-dependent protease
MQERLLRLRRHKNLVPMHALRSHSGIILKMTEAERRIIAAQGYVELGLFEEARTELSPLPAEMHKRVDVVEITLLCLMGGHRWEEALALATQLCTEEPAEPGGFIHAAFCLHELGRTAEAVDVLSRGPATLRTKPVYYYNMGCYHACLGHFDKSLTYLERSFEMDGELRQHARKDRDLDSLRAQLESHPA